MAKITIEDLKSFLWSAAEDLRGQIDAAGYKEYIFPLLFFKRISDVYDEQYAAFVAEGGEEYAQMQADELAIRIPAGQHWQDVREVTEDVGQRLVEAFIAIEQANPAREADGRMVGGLDGIFGPKDGWTNKNKMPDAIITSIIENFSRYNLSLANCPADEMGQAYEYLVGKFADDAGNTAQEFYTNRTVVELMAEILQPQPNESIYDPTCGSGGMLVKSLDYLRNHGKEWQGVQVFGQEVNGLTSSIARMNLYLNGVEDFSIACGDTLRNPAFIDGSRLRTFDMVLANPPYSIKEWDRTAFEHDKWGRNVYGTPPQARADYAFIQHIIASMDDKTGRCAILLPHGVLNRGEEKEMRTNHVKADNIDAVIGLGRNLFYNSGLESFVLICNKNKPTNRQGQIVFIEAEKLTHKDGKQAYLYPEDIEKIVYAYQNEEDIPGLSKHVSNDVVLQNDGNLNIKLYVKPVVEKKDDVNPIQFLNSTRESLSQSLSKFILNERDFPYLPIADSVTLNKANWKKVRLGDVADEYSARIDNPSASEYEFFIGSDCIGQYNFRIEKKSPSSGITSAQKLFKKGDYLLVRRSLYGSDFRERAPRADFDGICSADIITIREKEGVIADGFLIWVLYQRSLWDYIVSNSTGGLTRRISWKLLSDYEFDLPSIEEQKVMADKLWAAYKVKESYRQLLSTTDEMLKAKFQEMFGDGKYSVRLDSVCELFVDGDWIESKDQSTEGIRLVQTGNVGEGVYIDKADKAKFINEETFRRLNCTEIFSGDILISRLPDPIGRACVLPKNLGRTITAVDCTIIRLKKEKMLQSFFIANTLTPSYTKQIYSFILGTTRMRISRNNLASIQIACPPIEEQKRFDEIYIQAEATKASLRASIEAIDRVIRSLINQ